MSKGNPPVDKFQAFPVEIALFERENSGGEKWHNAQVSKTYKDENGDYRKTNNFSQNDLYKLNALVPQAITRMQTLDQEQRQTPQQAVEQDMDAIKVQAQERLQKQEQAQGQAQDHGETP